MSDKKSLLIKFKAYIKNTDTEDNIKILLDNIFNIISLEKSTIKQLLDKIVPNINDTDLKILINKLKLII